MKKEATIYDLRRMCLAHKNCLTCLLHDYDCDIKEVDDNELKKINTNILNWCKSHPIKTRLTEFLKMFPNCELDSNGYPNSCTRDYDSTLLCEENDCISCTQNYWDTIIE